MVSNLLSGPRTAAELARAMTERRYDVLIGTQFAGAGTLHISVKSPVAR